MKNRKWLVILCCVILVAAVVAAVVLLTRPKDTPKETEATAAPEATETAEKTGESRDVLKEIRDRGTVLIAMEGAWQPWTYHDEQGNLTGFDVEIGNLVAEGLGVKAEFKETAWDGILAGVDSGRFDMACNGVGYTEQRAKAYSFSTPYVSPEMGRVGRGGCHAEREAVRGQLPGGASGSEDQGCGIHGRRAGGDSHAEG